MTKEYQTNSTAQPDKNRMELQCRAYIEGLKTVQPQSAHRLKSFLHQDVIFKGPLGETVGRDQVCTNISVFLNSFDRINLKIYDLVWGEDGFTAYCRWDFGYKLCQHSALNVVSGMSEVMFNVNCKIVSQIDYWDSNVIDVKKPLFSTFFAGLKKKR